MKKNLLVFFLGLFTFLVFSNVNASASIKITCDKETINEGETTNCRVILNTTEEGITKVGFDINSEVFKYKVVSSCNGISTDTGGSYTCTRNFTNDSQIVSFSITAPKKFLNVTSPIKVSKIKIISSNGEIQDSSTYEKGIKINGSVPSSGEPSESFEIECPYFYHGIREDCDLILNLNASYYNGIYFEYNKGTIDDFSYDSKYYSSSGSGTHNGTNLVDLNGRTPPFVGKTVVGKIKIYPNEGPDSITLYNVKLFNGNTIVTSGGMITNGVVSTKNIGTVTINYVGKPRPTTLKDLRIDGKTIANFSSNTTTYNISLNNKSSVKIEGTASDPKGAVLKVGTFDLKQGMNTFVIESSAAIGNRDGSMSTFYTININNTDTRSTDNTLKTLSLSNISINFDPNKTNYSAEVGSAVTKTTISSTLSDSKSSYVKDFGNRTVNLKYGSNIILIKVKAENGNVKEYKVTINRVDNRSSVNTLKSLSVSVGEISFNSNTTLYSLKVDKDTSTMQITSELTDSKSSYVKDFGNRTVNLKYGINNILVKVKAENESIKEYKIVVNREDPRSTVNTLKTLDVSGYITDFTPEKKQYSFKVENSVKNVTITSELTDPKSSYVKNYGNRKVDLKEGNNTILVKVKAENESVNEYKITINRELSSALLKKNTTIEELKINDSLIEKDEDGNYTFVLKENKDKLDLNLLLTNSKATYEVVGNSNIKDGSIVKIIVTSEDKKETKEYNIKVKLDIPIVDENIVVEEKPKEKNNKIYYIIGGVVAAILCLGLVAGKSKPVVSVETTPQVSQEQTTQEPKE